MKVAESEVPVYQGRLMSPNEVRTALYQQGRALPHRYQQNWYLCGDVCEEFFRRVARDERITHSVSVFRVNGSTLFAVFCLQIREHQTRFLLPFASEKSVRFAEQIERTGVSVSLGRAGTKDALLLKFVIGENELRDLRTIVKRCSRLPCDVDINELKMASYSMTQALSIPNRSAETVVSEVCVNVILDD